MQIEVGETRTSKRKRNQHVNKSLFQYRLEQVLDSPGGLDGVLHLVHTATKLDIDEINESCWTPLVGAITLLGTSTTANGNSAESEERAIRLVRACHQRGISPNSGAIICSRYDRPLTVAAYYGYHSAVRLLIECGALPDLRNGDGENAFILALRNPTGRTSRLRGCDERTARLLLDLGVVTPDLGHWKGVPRGTLCYVNDCSQSPSTMYFALRNKNVDAVKFLCNAGSVITDRDYLNFRRQGRAKVRFYLLAMVAEVLSSSEMTTTMPDNATRDYSAMTKSQLMQMAKSWNRRIDWSFPPTWKVGVALCQNCGLPPAIFRTHVVPYLDRDWFYDPKLLVYQFDRQYAIGETMINT
ncbi:hypothetical protein ACHAXA_002735 [Cyclostephanos tholiformis]|uniref:Ankyrin repeat protein n=1 Tax=Cyclostephanos tholiformis TaxID=382380 RepID=A0ABD3RHB8_9STRA